MNYDKPCIDCRYFLLNINYKTKKMNKVDSPDYSINKANTEYFVHLIRIALADNVINRNEMEILYQISKKLGFTVAETDHLIRTTGKSDYNPPSELLTRFEQVFEIVNMTWADGSIDKNEMRLASGFAAKCGFNEKEIPTMLVLLLNGIRQGKNKAELFKEYQNKLKS
jgi:uncharacterized tellurite resistance protein B-like protein